MDPAGKVCLVTGAAKRVGRVIALAYAEAGARLLIHYNRSEAEARETARLCTEKSGLPAKILQAEQQDPAAIKKAVEKGAEETGGVDVLVNSASVFYPKPFLEMDPADWDCFLEVNLRGPAFFAQAVAPAMRKKGAGLIINITDVCGDVPWVGFLPYCVSKGGLTQLTKGLARELAPEIRVNAIGPGTVLLREGPEAEQKKKRAEETALLNRIGSPEDIAEACLFLTQSDYITGAFLPVDGGKSLWRPSRG